MSSEIIDLIRRNIKYCRLEVGLTQEQLSEKAGVSCDYLSEIERGKKVPSLKRLLKIAEALQIEPYKLLR